MFFSASATPVIGLEIDNLQLIVISQAANIYNMVRTRFFLSTARTFL
jgi:hypothetical protein